MRGQIALITFCFVCTRRQQNHRSFRISRWGTEKNVIVSETDHPLLSSLDEAPLSWSQETNTTTTAITTTSSTTTSVLLLNLVAVIWGSQHAVIKQVMESSDASLFTLLRFGLAALLAAPFTPGLSLLSFHSRQDENFETSKEEIAQIWRWGLEMGFWMFLGFSFQAIGLESTTAQRSGFLLYLNVKFVPFLAFVLLGRHIRLPTLISAVVAFTGTALLATEHNNNNGLQDAWNVGDAWSVAAAAASAMFILRLERASVEVANVAQFNSASLWVVATLSAVWTALSNLPFDHQLGDALWKTATEHGWEIVYLGGLATALTNWIQSKAQKGISAERAAVIYAMDPVYGAFFSSWLLGESLGGPQAWLGAGMITLAAVTNALLDFPEKGSTEKR